MTALRYPARLLRLLLVIGLGALLAAAVALSTRLGTGPRAARRQRLTHWFHGRLAAALPFRVTVHGKLPDTPMLWIGNHVSWTDIPLLGQLMPLAFLAKAEVRRWPLAGWLALQGSTLFIRRGASDSKRVAGQLAERLRQSDSVMLFPEGTSTDGTAVRTFHGRLLSGAIDAGVAIQPVAIRYRRLGETDPIAPFIGDDDLLSHLRRLLRNEVADVDIFLLAPLESQGRSRNELARQAQAAVEHALFGTAESLKHAAGLDLV
ncbi:lysophospholipid acyltransferase family protein [Pseudomonas sp. B392_1p]|uniref:lysophospholipid acyltransferase family protein n=1 Tax=Pseudomonas sp. B392_1p TaxID=3457507 RepID=UPI003FCEECAF